MFVRFLEDIYIAVGKCAWKEHDKSRDNISRNEYHTNIVIFIMKLIILHINSRRCSINLGCGEVVQMTITMTTSRIENV